MHTRLIVLKYKETDSEIEWVLDAPWLDDVIEELAIDSMFPLAEEFEDERAMLMEKAANAVEAYEGGSSDDEIPSLPYPAIVLHGYECIGCGDFDELARSHAGDIEVLDILNVHY